MAQRDFLGRGWAFPFGFDAASGAVASSEFEENIRQCVTVILGTRPGERQMLPTFGCRIHELLFAPNNQTTAQVAAGHVREALGRWDPRIEVQDVNASSDPSGAIRLEVVYRIVSTDAVQTLTHMVSNSGGR
jgi:phage baseplate assembly protein W